MFVMLCIAIVWSVLMTINAIYVALQYHHLDNEHFRLKWENAKLLNENADMAAELLKKELKSGTE